MFNMPVKSILLTVVIGLIAMTACSSDNLEEQLPAVGEVRPIVFAGQMQNETAVTRSALYDVTTSFKVWAYKNTAYNDADGYTGCQTVINGYTVNWSNQLTTTNSEGWEYVNGTTQTVKYWDMNALAYRYFGYAPSDAAVSTATTAGAMTLSVTADGRTPASVAATPYCSDLWFSTGHPVDYPERLFGQPVRMVFAKPLSRVHFLFTYADESTTSRSDLTNPSFHPMQGGQIATAGTVTITYPLTGTATTHSWTSTASAYISAMTDDYQTGVSEDEEWYYVLPTSTQGAYELTVNVNGEERTAAVPAEMMQWLPGYDYTYVFKINNEEVTFGTLTTRLTVNQNWQKGIYNHTEIE